MFTPVATRVLLLIVAIVVWDLVGRLGIVDRHFISSPGGVIGALPDLARSSDVREAVRTTGLAILGAFAIGTSAGTVAGYAIGLSKTLRRAYYGPLLLLASVPKSIFIPIFFLIFGLAHTALAFGAFEAFFYVTVNVVGGLDLVQDQHRVMARAFGASKLMTLREVVVPASLPGTFTAFWYGIRDAFTGVLIAELYASVGGLGELIRHYSELLKTDPVLALTLAVSIVAIFVGSRWTRAEHRLTRWKIAAPSA